MAENDPKPTPGGGTPFDSFSLVVRMLRDVAGMELSGLELRPELPRTVPVTQKRDGVYYLVALDFETPDAAENFRSGLEKECDLAGARVFLKNPPAIIRDERGNVFGLN
jgi:hypothetical protein